MSPSHEIPYIDLRGKSLTHLVSGKKQQVIDLINSIKGVNGAFSRAASKPRFFISDRISKNWLAKTNNPYLQEIEEYQNILGINGVYTLNLCYEWGCTTSVMDTKDGPVMTRVLDWPFPSMDTSMTVVHLNGPAGEFHNITWPGMAGVFNAVAKGRFSAAINQAPMRRQKFGIRATDWIRNKVKFNRTSAIPPAHLLRQVMEQAKDYDQAKKMLAETPIAIPVFFTLAGPKPGQGCAIERTETKASIREMQDGRVSVSNHFQTDLNDDARWVPRRDCTYPRAKAGNEIKKSDLNGRLSWFTAPIANEYSRLALQANTKTGKFVLIGTDGPKQTTKVFRR